MFVANAGSNSVWVGLEGINTGVVDNGQDPDQWIWKSLGTVSVSTPGGKALDIVRREDGYMIDRVVVTQGAVPGGTGPAESPRQGGYTFTEFATFASQWQRTDCDISNEYCSGADFDGNGNVDIGDLRLFAQSWLNSI